MKSSKASSVVRDLLLAALDEAFDRKSWHGTNLRGSLRGVSAARASWRPEPGRHNVWELALHAAYWKYVARRRLTGEKRGSFALEGSNYFPRPAGAGAPEIEAAWKADVALLGDEHRRLRAAVAAYPWGTLSGSKRAIHLIRGVAAHDLYHAGQIQLLKRMEGTR